MRFRFKAKRVKPLLTGKSYRIKKILTDLKGFKKEEVVYEVIEGLLRIIIREKVKKGRLGLKGLDGIDFRAGRYKNEPGRDVWIKVLYPVEELIDIEVKSSEDGAEIHKEKHKTSVVIVKDIKKASSLMKITKRVYNIIFERIREKLKKVHNGPD